MLLLFFQFYWVKLNWIILLNWNYNGFSKTLFITRWTPNNLHIINNRYNVFMYLWRCRGIMVIFLSTFFSQLFCICLALGIPRVQSMCLHICHKSHKYICGEKILIIARGKSWVSFLLKKVQCPFPLNGKFAFCVCGQRATRPSLTCSRLVMDPLLTFCSSLPNKVWNFGPMC